MSEQNKQLLQIQDELENAMKEDMMSDDEIQRLGTVTMVLTDQQKRERFLNQLKYSFAKAKNVKLLETS